MLESIPLHSTNLLTVLDETGIIQYESPAIERIFGFSQEELIGTQVAHYFHPDDREDVLKAFEAITESPTQTVESVEYRHKQADGSWCWVESVGSSNSTEEGHYVINTRDITEQKRHERELQRQNERLEDFAQIVSHDLRNPLNVAQGHLELAQDGGGQEHFDAVERAHKRMETLIEDLLGLASSETNVTDMGPVGVVPVVERSWDSVDADDAVLEVETESVIVADESRLAQLFENLFRNAVDHGGDDVAITVGELPDGFYVEDDGFGIPKSEQDVIFDTGYSSADSGTGLGLSIVETIAEAHGWSIDVATSESGGARFEFTGIKNGETAT